MEQGNKTSRRTLRLFVTRIQNKYGFGTKGTSVTAHAVTDWGSSVKMHGLVISSKSSDPKRRVTSVPVRVILPGIRVIVGVISTVSRSCQTISMFSDSVPDLVAILS